MNFASKGTAILQETLGTDCLEPISTNSLSNQLIKGTTGYAGSLVTDNKKAKKPGFLRGHVDDRYVIVVDVDDRYSP